MLELVTAHLLVALALPALARRSTRSAFLVAALLPAGTLGWALAEAPAVLDGRQPVEDVAWAPGIGLDLTFRLDPLALLMTVLVAGVGALVLVYARSYFDTGSSDGQRCAPLLLAFAGTMLGLVLADDLITLYVFWELTTICSFLLVGQAGISRESRRSALQALMITAFGGLIMLLGVVVLGSAAGTYRISALVAHPPSGTAVTVAAVLILVGALTKSAQIPFHNWLPAAMVAPTPVSAYLHAASMVKAGVFLVARMEPVFHEIPQWWVPAVVFGLVTMVVAGWRAMHEVDLKRLLAYGTVSQLGFLLVLVGAGTGAAALAGAAMLLAHGLFKASLFLVVGIVDHQAGTRDLRELSGLWRRMPVVAASAAVAAASMAGIPPLLGYVGKEAAFGAFAEHSALIEAGLVLGSVFTTGYSARLLWGAFATKPGLSATRVSAPSWWMVAPSMIAALACVVLGVGFPLVDAPATAYADSLGGAGKHLALWHSSLPAVLSLVALLGGLALHAGRSPLGAVRERLPKPPSAQRGYERIMAGLERTAVGVTGRVQVGSLPTYVGIILVTVLIVPGTAMVTGARPAGLPLLGTALQLPLALLVFVAAMAVLAARRRLTAVLMVGAVGYGVGGLFIVDGAPDLAMAQFLVETLTLVAFVFVLRRLPARFTEADTQRALRVPKMVVAGLCGTLIAYTGMVVNTARRAPPVASAEYVARAKSGAGAENVVNAIIVDFRAFDTIGEISVLAVTATGVASLILRSRFERRRRISSQSRTAGQQTAQQQAVTDDAAGTNGAAGAGEEEPT